MASTTFSNLIRIRRRSGNSQRSVSFEHTDASGMTLRSTISRGISVFGDLGEGSPVEFDPLGSNAGTSSPYFEPIAYNPDPEYPQLLLFYDDSPPYVNGQRLTCTLDGFAIGCSSAFQSLANGSAIPAGLAPYQNLPGFQFNSYGLGIYTANIPGHYFSTPNGSDSGNTIRVGSYGYVPPSTQSFSFGYQNISWVPQQQPPTPGNPPGGESDCEKQIAQNFGDDGAYFSDPHDGDPIDLTNGMSSLGNTTSLGGGDAHLYGSATDPAARTNLYVPKGGTLVKIGKSNSYTGRVKNGDSFIAIQFQNLDATLFVYHGINVTRGADQADGRRKVAEMGDGGGGGWNFLTHDAKGKAIWTPSFHYHFELLKGLRNTLPGLKQKKFLRLSLLCK